MQFLDHTCNILPSVMTQVVLLPYMPTLHPCSCCKKIELIHKKQLTATVTSKGLQSILAGFELIPRYSSILCACVLFILFFDKYVHVCLIGKLLLIYESVLVMDLGSTSCRKKQPIHSWNWKQQRG